MPLSIPPHQGLPMKSALLLSALASLAVLAAPAWADGQDESAAPQGLARPARLIAFTGQQEFLKESSRLRVWRSEVDYTLAVDPTGRPTHCELSVKFRMSYVNDRLCNVLLRTHSFEPAQDASGTAIEGTYAGHLNYMEMRAKG